MHFLAYDVKGIQQLIFTIPTLKCMIGASSQITLFDEAVTSTLCNQSDMRRIFAAGGRGSFVCTSREQANTLEKDLIKAAHQIGMDIRIGMDSDFSKAIREANRLYPYIPAADEMDGRPCHISGLWPVPFGRTQVHPVVRNRIREARQDRLGRGIRQVIVPQLPSELINSRTVEFFRNVNPERLDSDGQVDPDRSDSDDMVDQERARAGWYSLGSRNRWAVVAIDGNDIGRQFEELQARYSGEDLAKKLEIVSEALKRITEEALNRSLIECLRDWSKTPGLDLEACAYRDGSEQFLVLPFRPLIRGGDDVIVLAHSQLAMKLVERMAAEFARLSEEANETVNSNFHFEPWSRTGGRLTVSAGILYAKCSLPLHTAIPYAESLLGSAKRQFRPFAHEGQPTPAAVDWEAVTDSMIDTPAARRNRESVFIDSETDQCIFLTRRPYLLDTNGVPDRRLPRLNALRSEVCGKLESAPTSFLAELEKGLRATWSERTRFVISLAKDTRWSEFAKSLRQPRASAKTGNSSRWFSRWEQGEGDLVEMRRGSRLIQETDVLDAISLLAEERRMNQESTR